MIKSTTKKKVKKASSKKANPGKDWIRHADLRPKGGSPDRTSSKDSEKIISNQEYYAKLHRLAEDIQWEKRNEYPIHGYPWHRALEDASEILAKKKQNPSKKCRVIKVRRKISMGKGKRPRILQVRRKVCNPRNSISDRRKQLDDLENKKVKIYSGLPLSKAIPKTPGTAELIWTGKLQGRTSEIYSVLTDFHSYEFYFDDVAMIDGNKIYLSYETP